MTDRLCSVCEEPLDEARPWQEALDGSAAHTECLEALASWPDNEGEEE